MLSVLRRWGRALGPAGLCLLGATTWGQTATFSLEVAEVNGTPLAGGPTGHLTAAPGDVLTVKIFLRDWSPNGERLRAYQMELDPRGYTSGYSGNVQPVDFEITTRKQKENKKNCFIDTKDPQYIFAGKSNTIPITDTISPGHRFLNVVIEPAEATAAPQDGTKFYCGTVRLKVSDDASGPFTLRLGEEQGQSTLRQPDPTNSPITPLDFEHLTINVVKNGTLRILASDPPSGAVNARRPMPGADGGGGPWDRVTFRFTGDTMGLTPADFEVRDGSADPPRIKRLMPSGSNLTILLDRAIRAGTWTTITHVASSTGTRLGCLPGDVNNDGRTSADDILALIAAPEEGEKKLPLYRSDVDGDGASGIADALRVIDLLTQPDAYRTALKKP